MWPECMAQILQPARGKGGQWERSMARTALRVADLHVNDPDDGSSRISLKEGFYVANKDNKSPQTTLVEFSRSGNYTFPFKKT